MEFQHRGSPHAHTLLWLANDPKEGVAEDMMNVMMQLITNLCSVNRNDLDDDNKINNQIHRHTFTCTKRDDGNCCFSMLNRPINETRILLMMTKDDNCK